MYSWPSHTYSEETSQKDAWKVWYPNILLNSPSSNLSLTICFWPAFIFWRLSSHNTSLSYWFTSQIISFLPPFPVSVEIWGFDFMTWLLWRKKRCNRLTSHLMRKLLPLSPLYTALINNINIHLLNICKQM